MKRLLTILLLSLIIQPAVSHAQRPDIDLGLKVGANFSKINGKYWENGFKTNFMAGAFAAVNVKKIGGQLEFIFSQSTYTTGKDFWDTYKDFYNNPIVDSIKEGTFKVNYLSIPLLFNLRIFPKATIQFGPQYSGIVGTIQDKDELVKDARDLFKSGSIDGVVGVSLNLPLNLNIGARYVFGLSNINVQHDKINSTPQKIDDAWKQRTVQIHIGYSIL